MLILLLLGLSVPGYAAKKGYTSGAYSELNRNDSFFDRLSDWFATTGKSREERIIIKSRRRTARRMNDARKSIVRKKREIMKQKMRFREKLQTQGSR